MRAAGFLFFLMLTLSAMINVAIAQSGARGDGHEQDHDRYKDWQRPDVGGSCCNAQSADDLEGDCRPTTAYMGDDGRWRARIKPGSSGFVVVPPNKILNRAPDGRCHICERLGAVFCFRNLPRDVTMPLPELGTIARAQAQADGAGLLASDR